MHYKGGPSGPPFFFRAASEFARLGDKPSAVRTFSALQVREPIHRRSIGAWREFAQELEPLRVALEQELRTSA
jgi:hypothetical protein